MEYGGKAGSWPEEEILEPTSDPNSLLALSGELPTLTMTTIIGMTVVMVVAIAAVFIIGILIDCRQQRIINEQMIGVKRLKGQRRVNTHPEDDVAGIANNMEEPGTSAPPAEVLRHIP